MVPSEKKMANAMGGKTARACDSCIRKRARWYCAADDAFLCQACDGSIHLANPLARRHERVRLKTSSNKHSEEEEEEATLKNSLPSWLAHGFTKKARTPRHSKHPNRHGQGKVGDPTRNPIHLVPEMGVDETSHEEHEQHLLYRVPVFDPFAAELCTSENSNEEVKIIAIGAAGNEGKVNASINDRNNSLNRFLPSEMDLAEFAADVESFLGKALDEESVDMEGLGLVDCKDRKNSIDGSFSCGKLKVENDDREEEEEEEEEHVVKVNRDFDSEIGMMREPFELNFDYEEDDKAGIIREVAVKEDVESGVWDEEKKKNIVLRLDYDGVITAWADQRSPWTTGERPVVDPNDCWPDCMGACGTVHYRPYGDIVIANGHNTTVDGSREARVTRYREKRRTRLFSKKIRYEVRKLNAEKRPRMKGRFVKRANFAGSAFPLPKNS